MGVPVPPIGRRVLVAEDGVRSPGHHMSGAGGDRKVAAGAGVLLLSGGGRDVANVILAVAAAHGAGGEGSLPEDSRGERPVLPLPLRPAAP